MGSWNFYLELKTDTITLNNMIREYNQNSTYQTAFHFGIIEGYCKTGFNTGFSSVIDNFLPENHLIYNFLSHFVSCHSYIKANEIEHMYDFSEKSDFIKFMYDAWETKIDFVYEQLGALVINHKQYYKTRDKLHKKYYKKFASTAVAEENERL